MVTREDGGGHARATPRQSVRFDVGVVRGVRARVGRGARREETRTDCRPRAGSARARQSAQGREEKSRVCHGARRDADGSRRGSRRRDGDDFFRCSALDPSASSGTRRGAASRRTMVHSRRHPSIVHVWWKLRAFYSRRRRLEGAWTPRAPRPDPSCVRARPSSASRRITIGASRCAFSSDPRRAAVSRRGTAGRAGNRDDRAFAHTDARVRSRTSPRTPHAASRVASPVRALPPAPAASFRDSRFDASNLVSGFAATRAESLSRVASTSDPGD